VIKGGAHAVRQRQCHAVVSFFDRKKHNRETITIDAGDNILVPYTGTNSLANFCQHPVPGFHSKPFINGAKFVDVDIENSGLTARCAFRFDKATQAGKDNGTGYKAG